ncbi:MAG TPA: NAD-dependent deacylase [Candidatus Marinimicrobia bacterium]|nr:NAD-dependent deacylase [Candidatus Neomarinimicrobiota bacterium]
MRKLVVLTGAGMSAESGLKTFRDMGGLWEQYDVYEVASPRAWERDPSLVLRFYNERRKQLLKAEPNQGHLGLVELESMFDVRIITQNVDDLHERAGSSNILHLHGELRKSRSTKDPSIIYDIDGEELNIGDFCELGSQLRPHVVWFGEAVPAIEEAISIAAKADIFVVIGTSLNVYPAAGLLNYIRSGIPVYLIDPGELNAPPKENYTFIKEPAGKGVRILIEQLSMQT